ncbi:ribosome recycling factor [Phocaeicola barnesiae]
MNIQVINIQNDFQQNLNGNVGFLLYCFMNLCVKAEGAALLSSEFVLGGQVVPIEDLGNVSIPDKSRLCVVPKEEEYIPLIIQGVLQEHPELKPAVMTVDQGKLVEVDETDEQEDQEEVQKLVVFTVPEVNEDRYDALKQGVDTFYEKCKVDMEKNYTECIAKLTGILKGASAEEIDTAKEETEGIYNKYVETRDKMKTDKLQEIEDAYQLYLKKHTEEENIRKEQADAKGEKAGFSMNMFAEGDEE